MGGLRLFSVKFLLIFAFAPAVWGQQRDWEKEWKGLIAEAKKEGKLVMHGPVDPFVRRALPPAFAARFNVSMEYLSSRGADIARKIQVERRAGLTSLDIVMSGVTTHASALYPEKLLDPLRPELLLPDVLDPSKWKDGKVRFADPDEQYVLRLHSYVSLVLCVNTKYAKPEEFRTGKDLLNPKWQGKISSDDPTVSGSGLGTAANLYTQLGKDFVRRLYIDQRLVISRDKRQRNDWLARGSYPVSLCPDHGEIERLQQEGFPIAIIDLADVPGTLSGGSGFVGLLKNRPHPHAARLFVNWIASREGMEVLARAKLYPVTRNDIHEVALGIPPEAIPRRGVNYLDTASWEYQLTKSHEVMQFMKEILKR